MSKILPNKEVEIPHLVKKEGFGLKTKIEVLVMGLSLGLIVVVVLAVRYAGPQMLYAAAHQDEVNLLIEGDKLASEVGASASASVKTQIKEGVSRAFIPEITQ